MTKRSPAWQHGVEVEGETRKVRCNYCARVVSDINRLRHQILGTRKDVTTCPAAPVEARLALGAPHQGEPAGRVEDVAIGEVPLLELEPEIYTKVALKGLKGDCTEDAAFTVYARCTAVPCQTIKEALQVVESHQADEAIIPIENSFDGSIAENYDLIYDHSLHIVSEVSIATNLCILALAGVKLEELTLVLGTPQELAQANSYLSNLGVQTETVRDDNLRDAQFIRLSAREQVGIIANAKAAEVYALNVLAEGIQGDNVSFTRFWIMGREPVFPWTSTAFKTSVAFTLDDGAQKLPQALLVFHQRKLKLTKVEPRPQRNRPSDMASSSTGQTTKCFNYIYFVDFESSLADSGNVEKALNHLKEFATSVRVLGVYSVIEVNREV